MSLYPDMELCWLLEHMLRYLSDPYNWQLRDAFYAKQPQWHRGIIASGRLTVEDILGLEDLPF